MGHLPDPSHQSPVKFYPSRGAPDFALVSIAPAKTHSSVDQYNDRNPVVLPYDPEAPVNACAALRALFQQDPVPIEKKSPDTPLP